MKIVFHPDFLWEYTYDPAAAPGRLEPAYEALAKKYPMIRPEPCGDEDVLRVHTPAYVRQVRNEGLCGAALLAAGAAVAAAELAIKGEMAFALCRPPGHHASCESAWGFCYFNNVAVAVKRLLDSGRIRSALIVDFDLHYGDGTENIFSDERRVTYWQAPGRRGKDFVRMLEAFLGDVSCDLVAVSAGFDRHERDWGGMLTTEDYRQIGVVLGAFAHRVCGGRLFSVLEGGYNPVALGESIEAYLLGLQADK